MSRQEITEYSCDNCGKRLPGCAHGLNIVTSKNESEIGWSRLHVRIELRHGSHNNGKSQLADLCQECAIALLTDALARVKKGERASAGAESPYAKMWDGE